MYNQSMNQSSFHRTLLIVLDFTQLEHLAQPEQISVYLDMIQHEVMKKIFV